MKILSSVLFIVMTFNNLLLGQTTDLTQNLPDGFTSLFNGRDFTNWRIPSDDNGHWKIVENVIDYDGESEARDDKNLWTTKSYKNFVLYVDWRIKDTWKNPRTPLLLPNGFIKLDENGMPVTLTVNDSDSGILLHGNSKCQTNIECWPVGSGEVHGCWSETSDPEKPNHIIPKIKADKNVGEWNTFKISLIDNLLAVELNGTIVIENILLKELDNEGPIGLQHHGTKKDGKWISTPSLIQFRRVYIKEL